MGLILCKKDKMKNLIKYKIVKVILGILIVSILFFGTPVGAYAISLFNKTLAGMGQMTYTNEVTITDIKVKSLSKVTVTIESSNATVADRVYTVALYLDDVKQVTTQSVSWTVIEIPGTKKKVDFTSLDLALVVSIDAEVIY